jgi:hypothetical protein
MTAHLTEEQLVLHYYGEPDDTPGTDEHLAECGQCRSDYQKLVVLLNTVSSAPVPEPGDSYGTEVWSRVQGSVRVKRGRFTVPALPGNRWAAVAAMASMVVIAFVAGRFSIDPSGGANPIPGEARERILMLAVGNHLERSQMVLAEILNADPHSETDLSTEQQRASDLVQENRLYRQTAAGTGDAAVAGLLDELGRVLLEIADGLPDISPGQLQQIQQRIRGQGLMFKLRVVRSTARNKTAISAHGRS